MKRLTLLLIITLACGDSSGPPPPPPARIVKLVMAPDTGFWRGQKISLAQLVRGAVNSDGDTVAAPSVTWTVPNGFAREGDSLAAMREARGNLTASINAVTAVIATATLDDLSERSGWASAHRCYNSPNSQRGVEETPIGVDSAIVTQQNGVAEYTADGGGWSGAIKLRIWVDEQIVRFWRDGVVDTVLGRTAIIASQDTLRLALGTNIGSAAPWMKRISEAPMKYRLDPPGICSSDWVGADGRHDPANPTDGGTAFELWAP